MSKFVDVGANCFLSSDCKEKILAPNPTTERGQSLHINAHPKSDPFFFFFFFFKKNAYLISKLNTENQE